jgi:hypothetical protein
VGFTKHTDKKFEVNNLDDIRKCKNNTKAFYTYLSKNPWSSKLKSNISNDIVHTFPLDNSIFDTIEIERQVIQ